MIQELPRARLLTFRGREGLERRLAELAASGALKLFFVWFWSPHPPEKSAVA